MGGMVRLFIPSPSRRGMKVLFAGENLKLISHLDRSKEV